MARKTKAEKQREDIEQIAWEIYSNRQRLERPGDEHSDWVKAEKIFYNSIGKALFANQHPLVKLEKELLEPLLAWANDQAILSLLGLIGNLGLIVAIATYIGSEKQRRDAEVFNAWQMITSAYGQAGSGGRIQALEFLNASPGAHWRRKFPWICAPLPLCTWQAENLSGINLSVPDGDGEGVYLVGANLKGANLGRANFEGADIQDANLEGAELWETSLKRANLQNANLEGAQLWRANLEGAELQYANLKGANLAYTNLQNANLEHAQLESAALEDANLQRANLRWSVLAQTNLRGTDFKGADLLLANLTRSVLWGADLKGASLLQANLEEAYLNNINLEGANLQSVNFKGAQLGGANLRGADFNSSNLEGAYLNNANLEGARNLTQDQLALAILCRTTMPRGITLDSNRDCEELGIDPETGY